MILFIFKKRILSICIIGSEISPSFKFSIFFNISFENAFSLINPSLPLLDAVSDSLKIFIDFSKPISFILFLTSLIFFFISFLFSNETTSSERLNSFNLLWFLYLFANLTISFSSILTLSL